MKDDDRKKDDDKKKDSLCKPGCLYEGLGPSIPLDSESCVVRKFYSQENFRTMQDDDRKKDDDKKKDGLCKFANA